MVVREEEGRRCRTREREQEQEENGDEVGIEAGPGCVEPSPPEVSDYIGPFEVCLGGFNFSPSGFASALASSLTATRDRGAIIVKTRGGPVKTLDEAPLCCRAEQTSPCSNFVMSVASFRDGRYCAEIKTCRADPEEEEEDVWPPIGILQQLTPPTRGACLRLLYEKGLWSSCYIKRDSPALLRAR